MNVDRYLRIMGEKQPHRYEDMGFGYARPAVLIPKQVTRHTAPMVTSTKRECRPHNFCRYLRKC